MSSQSQPAVGVVLAGGASRRMGVDKAEVVLGGRTLLDWVAGTLEAATGSALVAGRPDAGSRPGITDPGPSHRGPAAGILAALDHVGGDIVVVGTDQPWIRRETLLGLVATPGLAVVPRDERLQVTCAVYRPAVREIVADSLESRGSLQNWLADVATVVGPEDWPTWGEDGRSWYSVNRPDDLRRGIELYGLPA